MTMDSCINNAAGDQRERPHSMRRRRRRLDGKSLIHSSEQDPCLIVVGTWLSLVEHSLGVRGVGSSNLPVPTKFPEN